MRIFIRWFLFLFIGFPVQLLLYLLYPVAVLFWWVLVHFRMRPLFVPPHSPWPRDRPFPEVRPDGFLANTDNHGAFTLFGMREVVPQLDALISPQGSFYRKPHGIDMHAVSGDVVVAWCFTYASANVWGALSFTRSSAIRHYMKNLGSVSDDGWVSNKCNNMGLNYCPDGWGRLGQPAAGPQFYTTSALLALGYDLGFRYKVLFWCHWILLGGWYWAFCPIIYLPSQKLNYVRDITMKALYVHKCVFGNVWWVRLPMWFIREYIAEVRNDLFFAMDGQEISPNFPECGTCFFSQRQLAQCEPDGAGADSQFLRQGLLDLVEKNK